MYNVHTRIIQGVNKFGNPLILFTYFYTYILFW